MSQKWPVFLMNASVKIIQSSRQHVWYSSSLIKNLSIKHHSYFRSMLYVSMCALREVRYIMDACISTWNIVLYDTYVDVWVCRLIFYMSASSEFLLGAIKTFLFYHMTPEKHNERRLTEKIFLWRFKSILFGLRYHYQCFPGGRIDNESALEQNLSCLSAKEVTSPELNQSWASYLTPFVITRGQCVNT